MVKYLCGADERALTSFEAHTQLFSTIFKIDTESQTAIHFDLFNLIIMFHCVFF